MYKTLRPYTLVGIRTRDLNTVLEADAMTTTYATPPYGSFFTFFLRGSALPFPVKRRRSQCSKRHHWYVDFGSMVLFYRNPRVHFSPIKLRKWFYSSVIWVKTPNKKIGRCHHLGSLSCHLKKSVAESKVSAVSLNRKTRV
jgi:hypothetical protein